MRLRSSCCQIHHGFPFKRGSLIWAALPVAPGSSVCIVRMGNKFGSFMPGHSSRKNSFSTSANRTKHWLNESGMKLAVKISKPTRLKSTYIPVGKGLAR